MKDYTYIPEPSLFPPDEPDPDPVYYCDECGRPIYPGECYYDFDCTPVCEDCVNSHYKEAYAP